MLKLIAVAAVLMTAQLAFAEKQANVEREIQLKDGSTVYIFKDGKMAMEDKLGRTVSMAPGHVMETRDGQRIQMVGDETARLQWILKSQLGGGN